MIHSFIFLTVVDTYLTFPCGNGGILIDEFSEDPAQGLDPQGQGSDIQQDDVLDFTP